MIDINDNCSISIISSRRIISGFCFLCTLTETSYDCFLRLVLTIMVISDCHTHIAVHHHLEAVGKQHLRYTGPPIYILLAFYYHCVNNYTLMLCMYIHVNWE